MNQLHPSQLTATVVSKVPLSDSEQKELMTILTSVTGQKDVTVEYSVDEDVLGGIRVDVGDWVLDTTIANQLNKLKDSLLTE